MTKWLGLLFLGLNVHAQDIDLGGATLEDLLNVKTAVASKREVSARATPGIVTIITDEEIRNMGARDLIDVLSLVPSISFGTDVQGGVGLGIRGMWAHEGKHLLIIDGIERNELQYGTTHFGNEFPVDQIKRIEIVRGPGSAIYGGFAQQAVINIITKSGKDIDGVDAGVMYGLMKEGSERLNWSASHGQEIAGWEYSVAGYMGKAGRGEGQYTGYLAADGADPAIAGSYDYKDADKIKSSFANLGVSNGDFTFRFQFEQYEVTSRSMFGFTALDTPIPVLWRNYDFLAKYDLKIGDKWKITPQVQYNMQNPWRQNSEEAFQVYQTYDVHTARVKPNITASYDVNEKINVLGGYEYYSVKHKIADQKDDTGDLKFSDGSDEVSYDSSAYFLQGLYQTGFLDVTLGARYENPNFADSSFVPRFGVTHAEKEWHAKALYAQAFRTPVMQNIEVRPGIKPEHAETAEIEYGHSITSRSYLTANIFNTRIKDPIIYFVDTTTGSDQYDNFPEVGTRGIELDYRYKPVWGQLQVAYAFYQVNTNKVDKYKVNDEDDALLAMPQHKAILNAWINVPGNSRIKVNPGLIYVGERYSFEYSGDLNTGMTQRKQAASVLANLFVSRDDLFVKGLGVGLGVYNIFDQDVRFIQPYNGDHSPQPGPSREVAARLDYSF